MSEHILKMLGLTKDKVSTMMQSTYKHPSRNHNYLADRSKRVQCAYELIKSGARIDKAAVVFSVKVHDIIVYAKDKKLVHPLDFAHAVPPCKSYEGWQLSMQIGVSSASRKIGCTRRAIYSFAKRYNLPTPCRP